MGGQKHEDNIMKENAKLQKEVKYRIQYMKKYMEKIDKGLEDDNRKAAEERDERERSERAAVEERRESRERGISRSRDSPERESKESRREKKREESESSSEKQRKKKKKKRAKERSSSSRESEQEQTKKKKKKKKAKSRERSSESESASDSDAGKKVKMGKKDKKGVIHMDEDVFRMVADLKGSKKKTGGHSEDVLMDLLGKMSEAYMKGKNENTELLARCKTLEMQNGELRRRLEQLEVQIREEQ